MRCSPLIAALPVALIAAGCTMLGDSYQRPKVAAPPAWQGKLDARAPAWPDSEWWKRFENRELDRLIAAARANNNDLKAAAARVAQARANARIAGAALFPLVTLEAEVGRSKEGLERSSSSYAVVPQASYELDVWGKNRYARDAGEAALASGIYDRGTVALILQADVATSYFLALSLKDRIRVAQENLAIARQLLDLIETQRRAGKISGLEVERSRSQVATAEAAIPPLVQQFRVTQDALAVLLGGTPDSIAIAERTLRTGVLPAVGAGLPAQLLERRPDIRRAEADLIAANANVGAARAAIYPSLVLHGAAGYRSVRPSDLFNVENRFYSTAAALLATIFDGGVLAGSRELAEGRRAELVAIYYRTVLVAFREVEDALAGIEQFAAQDRAQLAAVTHAREAYRLAESRYRLGATDFTTVLDAQRTLLGAEAALDPVRFARFAATVQLYRALGGGWEDPAGAAATREKPGPR